MKRIFNIIYKSVLLSAVAVLPLSCNKFLDEMPDNRTELDTPDKIAQVLVSAYASVLPSAMMELMSDNLTDYGREIDVYQTYYEQAYRFQDVTGDGIDSPAVIWEANYNAIAAANAALQAIEDLGGGEDMDYIKGEALLCRAYGHFTLVTTFCQAYNTESSDEDMGVPYVTEPETTVYVDRERGTVADVYAKIADDIEDGYPLIDDTRFTEPKYHFNKAAAAAFAAQFFLYYGDYEKAVYYATEAIGTDPTPLYRDWSLYTGTSVDEYANAYISTDEAANFLNQGYNSIANRIVMGRFIMTEPIATSEILGSTPWGNVASLDIGTAYSYSSRAYLLPKQTEYFIITDAVSQTGTPYCVNVVFTSEKTMIDRAEAYALDGNYGAAATDLNHFYHSLGLTATLTADEISAYYSTATVNNPVLAPKGLTLSDGLQTNLVKACIHARRIMTVQEGGRLLDLKRYGIAYTHELDGEAPVNVQPYDLRLAIQLPSAVVSAGMTPNPR